MWIGVSASLAPVLHFRGIRIANAPWADSNRPFASLASATAVFSWKSIDQRRPVIALWILADGEVDLERTADGLRNWRLTNPEYRGPGRWKVLAVQGERATVRFLHGGMDLDVHAVASAAADGTDASGARTHPTRIELQGRWRKLPFSLSADTGPILTFLETGETFPVRGRLEAGGARLDLDGSAGDIVHRPVVDARVSLAARSLAPFSAFVATRHGDARAIHVEGALKTGDDRYALSGATARVGATDLAGESAGRAAKSATSCAQSSRAIPPTSPTCAGSPVWCRSGRGPRLPMPWSAPRAARRQRPATRRRRSLRARPILRARPVRARRVLRAEHAKSMPSSASSRVDCTRPSCPRCKADASKQRSPTGC